MARHGSLLLFTGIWLALARFWGLLHPSTGMDPFFPQKTVSGIQDFQTHDGSVQGQAEGNLSVTGTRVSMTLPDGAGRDADPYQTQNAEFVTVSRSGTDPLIRVASETGTHTTRTVRLAPHTLLVLLSLDTAGAMHRFQIQARQAEKSLAKTQAPGRRCCESVGGPAEPRTSPVTGVVAGSAAAQDGIPSGAIVVSTAEQDARQGRMMPPLNRAKFPGMGPSASTPLSAACEVTDVSLVSMTAAAPRPELKPFRPVPAAPRTIRRFRMPRFTGSQVVEELREACECLRTPRVSIFVEAAPSAVAVIGPELQILATRIAELCDLGLPDAVEQELGPIRDVDGDGRLAIVLTPLDQGQTGRRIPVRGCVREADFLDPWSGLGGDILYLDQDSPRMLESRELLGLLAHELTHAAVYSRLVDRRESGLPELGVPGWFHEAVAHRVEHDLAGPAQLYDLREQLYRQQPGNAPVCADPRVLSNDGCRGGARVAAVRFLDAMQRPGVSVGGLLMQSHDFDALLETCVGMPLRSALEVWSQQESRRRLAEAAEQIQRLTPESSALHRIHGTAFLVFQSGPEPLEMEIRCEDTSDWTLAVIEP